MIESSEATACSSRGLPSGYWRWIIRPVFAWYGLWVGVYIKQQTVGIKVYVLPLPCVGIVVAKEWILRPVGIPCRVGKDNGDGTCEIYFD